MRFIKYLIKLSLSLTVGFTTLAICFSVFFIFFCIVVAIIFTVAGDSSENYETVFGSKESENKILSLNISGVIMGDQNSQNDVFGTLNTNTISGYVVKQQLITASKDPTIKGVVLEISSPGGTIFGSRAIEEGVEYYKEKTHKPVYAFVSGLAASGAYMASLASDKIFADYGSAIGSIGVIFGPFKYYDKVLSEDSGLLEGGVVTQNGIQQFTFTAGKYKDFGNPYRKMTQVEIDSTQKTVDDEYDNFVTLVSDMRHIPASTIRDTLGALIYDNKMAKEYNLIDGTLNREKTYDLLALKAGVKNEDFQVVRKKSQPTLINALVGSIYHANTPGVSLKNCSVISTVLAYHGDLANLCN